MFKAISGLFAKKPYQISAQLIYKKLVTQARDPYFYKYLSVKDDIDGRFDMICLHLYLVLDRLENNPTADDMTQYMVNYMISDMDRNFREMGVSDIGVGRKVQKLATALYGRLEIYQISNDKIATDGGKAFAAAICRNIYRSDMADNNDNKLPYDKISKYAIAQQKFLAKLNLDDLLVGNISFILCEEAI